MPQPSSFFFLVVLLFMTRHDDGFRFAHKRVLSFLVEAMKTP